MKYTFYIPLLLFPSFLLSQTGDSVKDNISVVNEKYKAELANELQNGLAKLGVGNKNNDQAVMLDACLEIADLYEKEKYYSKALTYFEQAVSLANELGLHEVRLAIQSSIAQSLFDDGQLEQANEASLDLFEQHQIFGLYEPALKDLELLAETSLRLGNFAKAKEYFKKIEQLAMVTTDEPTAIVAMNNMGFTATRLQNYEEAIDHFSHAELNAMGSKKEVPGYIFTNLGIAWYNIGNLKRAIKNLQQAEGRDKEHKSYIQHLISSIYFSDDDLYNALKYNELAIASAKKSKDMQVMADAHETASEIYQQLYEYDKALDHYKAHLSLKDSLERIAISEQQHTKNIHDFMDETENSFRQNLIESELRQANLAQMELTNQTLQLEAETQRLEQEKQSQQMALLMRDQDVKEANLRAAQLEADRTKQELRLTTQRLLAEKQSRELASLNQKRHLDSLEAARTELEQQQQNALLESQLEVAELQAKQQQDFVESLYWLAGFFGIIMLIITGSWLYGRRLNKKLADRNEQIEKQKGEIESERIRAEGLLLNILPKEVANELKDKGAATPKHYDSATVLFTDFQGFTKIAATMPPAEVVSELNECFLKFDEIAEKYRLEKIKTMGDAYMCAGGLPVENDTHPVDAIAAAKEILAFIEHRNQKLAAAGKAPWPIRIGIHTGELVAGVVGSKKFAYDIWGDTVNVASRMETNSEPGQINISEATYDLVKAKFECKYRGEVEVKNKGKMGMYLVG